MTVYVHPSALVGLVVPEPQSTALAAWVEGKLGSELEAVVTYDARMTRAAAALGLPVAAPSSRAPQVTSRN